MVIVKIDNKYVYMNKSFWSNFDIDDFIKNYEDHEVLDFFNKKIELDLFKAEMMNVPSTFIGLETITNQVLFNIGVGKEFIALFREEFVRTPLKEMTSLDIAQKTANLIPLILTGSFREACDLLRLYEPDEFMTRERIDKYIAMLTSADAIDYNYEETLSCEDKSEGNVDIEPSEPLEQEENQNKPETI